MWVARNRNPQHELNVVLDGLESLDLGSGLKPQHQRVSQMHPYYIAAAATAFMNEATKRTV